MSFAICIWRRHVFAPMTRTIMYTDCDTCGEWILVETFVLVAHSSLRCWMERLPLSSMHAWSRTTAYARAREGALYTGNWCLCVCVRWKSWIINRLRDERNATNQNDRVTLIFANRRTRMTNDAKKRHSFLARNIRTCIWNINSFNYFLEKLKTKICKKILF